MVACLLAASALLAEERYTGVGRVVAISDVHGAFDAMQATLRQSGVLDADSAWAGGDTHLVVTGDLLDRGPDSRKVMDHLMALEGQAAAAGGRVHVLLGNHEVMNLVGDLRYVAAEEYAAFADDETPEQRDRWFERYVLAEGGVADRDALRQKFDEGRPPGFFAHREAFRGDGKYGRWLLEKPLVVVLNDTAYVHGGLSPSIAELGLGGVNESMRAELTQYVAALDTLTEAGVLDPVVNFYDHAAMLERLPKEATGVPAVTAAIETVMRLSRSSIHQLDSPLWYRGNIGCGPLIEIDRLAPVLDRLGAERVVIGHTPTQSRQVLSRLAGRVVEIDTGMLTEWYEGTGNALVLESGSMTVVNEYGDSAGIREHPRHVGLRPKAFSGADLEAVLERGEISPREELDDGRLRVSVTDGGATLEAVFIPSERGGDFSPDLASYRLDRFLELGMIPVTVRREFDGREGALQFVPAGTMTEAERTERRQGGSAWCPLPDQWNAMYVFDALIHNPVRGQHQMLYSQENWQLILTGHGGSFDTSRSRPDYLREVALDIGSAWQERLRALDRDTIDRQFGDVLDRRRRSALERRRDALLEDAARQP